MTQPPPAGGWPDPASAGQPSSPPADPLLSVPSQPAGYDPYQPADPYPPIDSYAAKSDLSPAPAPYPPPGYPPPVQPGYGYGYGYPQRSTNSLALVGLILSLIGIGSCITAPIGAIMGHVAIRQIRETGEEGEGMAKAAIIVGWIITAFFALVVLVYVAIFVIWATAVTTV
ncbi:DUF4190 domain-containing protein [Verrucosispora sp. SN26_14.1]|uniref:DUF4190 domain-containing protein n=1 Tax=Verrucosispora sp. SN26_14.1 TaxID=2527879 RepID=UPI001033094D|nr:DUF4190 domain-containing protein [Verrucosispora sp. SN26_14.1]TBL33937.1 DUF4190 domain-containing protein [Verrucosispora sp. SN26_14.1]